MDEDFLDVTESSNKLVLFVLITITLFILVFGYFFVYQKFHFSLKTVKLEINSEVSLNVNDYLKNSVVDTSGYELDVSKVKTDTIGEYFYTITYNKRTKRGKVKVVDTTPPKFVTKELTVEVGNNDLYLGDLLESCEDNSKPCLVTLKSEKDESIFDKVGTYKVKILVSDLYNNNKEAEVTINVVPKGSIVDERTLDLEFYSSSSELKNFSDEYYAKLERAIEADSEEARDVSSQLSTIDLEEYVNENYEGYELKNSELIEVYNKDSFIIGYVIRITIDNGSLKTVYVTK